MSNVILLNKERDNFNWSYVFEGKRYAYASQGPLLIQAVDVITHIRDTHDLFEREDIAICSTSFVKTVFYDLALSFPMMRLVPVVDADIIKIFNKTLADPSSMIESNVKRSNTLFICSDASKGNRTELAGWAWFASGSGRKKVYNFGVTENRSIVEVEFEGILRAISDNADTDADTIHVYCDSKRSVEFAQAVLDGRYYKLDKVTGTRLARLIRDAEKVIAEKDVRVQWVKGHRNHRLNMGADFLAKKARYASESGRKLHRTDGEVAAVMNLFP